MNQNSVLCKFIDKHQDTWKEELENKNIIIKTEDDYYIFNYDIAADFSDPIVQECRGIILNHDYDVVCYPFRKFGNYTESYADHIDWRTARVQEKLDGSLLKLWYDKDRWHWSTNGQITIDDHFYKLLLKCWNYNMINYDILDKNFTYMFELTSPENQIVLKYNDSQLYHIGSRNNKTGKEANIYIGIEQPHQYKLQTLNDCIIAANELNPKDYIRHEGFVVVDDNWNRVKIKTPEYFMWHRIIGNHSFKKDYFLDLIINKSDMIQDFCNNFPSYDRVIKYYEWQYSEFIYRVDQFVIYANNIYAEYSYERKALANTIKNHPYAAIAFKCIDKNIDAKQFIRDLPVVKIMKFIKEYKDE